MKFKYIDALRGIAIFLVMIVHTSQYGEKSHNEIFNSFFKFGAKGVQLFFLASAFTLFLSYNNRNSQQNKNSLRDFYIRRFFRIAPMYYLGIIYFSLQNQNGIGDTITNNLWNVLSNIFFIHGISPYWINNLVPGGWSITVEVFFYIILPLLITIIKNLNQAVIFTLVSFIVSMIFRLLLQKIQLIDDLALWNEFSYYNFITQLPAFGLGIISYFLIIKKDFEIAPINTLIIFFIVTSHFIWGVIIPNFILIGICFLILIYILSLREYKIFVNKFTLFLGKISYSAYLVHFAVLLWVDRNTALNYFIKEYSYDYYILNFTLRLSLVIFITTIIAYVFFKIIEIPFQKLGKKIIEHMNKT